MNVLIEVGMMLDERLRTWRSTERLLGMNCQLKRREMLYWGEIR